MNATQKSTRAARLRASVLLAALLAGLAPSAPVLAAGQPAGMAQIDRVLAVVNNEVITEVDLSRRLKNIKAQLVRHGTPLPEDAVLRKQLLEQMIMERVELQAAQDNGVRVDDAQVDQTLARIINSNHMNAEQFRRTLENDGNTLAQFRDDLRTELLIGRLRDRMVNSQINVSDSEVDSFLQANKNQIQGEYLLDHILVRLPSEATAQEIAKSRTRAEAALAQLKKGQNFGKVAATYSDAPDALSGGRIDWRPLSQLPTLFVDALKDLQPGGVSGILRSPNGFHIIRLVDRRGGQPEEYQIKTHVRHILVKTSELVSNKEAYERLAQLRQRLAAGADFAEMARLHSDDASAARGGDLGWVAPGETVPDFEHAMDALKPGEISQPVQSQFGWHLIQVLERKKEDVTRDSLRARARQAIGQRKSDEAWTDYLRELRDAAFVSYKTDQSDQ